MPNENFQPTWKQFYEPRKALNLGFSGDTTAHLLWRLDHGEVDGLHPKAVVLLIGTNNTGHHNQSAEETEIGIDAYIVKPVKQSRLFECLINAIDKAPVDNVLVKAPEPISISRCSERSLDIEKVRILLAEDNAINKLVALSQLRKLRYSADAVTNGLEVLEALKQTSYDIIFMDCQMPEMDGYETTGAIRKREQSLDQRCSWKSPVHIIAMTANAMLGDREKCLAAGMDDYLSKPVRLAELQAVLERWRLAFQN